MMKVYGQEFIPIEQTDVEKPYFSIAFDSIVDKKTFIEEMENEEFSMPKDFRIDPKTKIVQVNRKLEGNAIIQDLIAHTRGSQRVGNKDMKVYAQDENVSELSKAKYILYAMFADVDNIHNNNVQNLAEIREKIRDDLYKAVVILENLDK